MDTLNNKNNSFVNMNPFQLLANNEPGYLINRFSNIISNNLFAKNPDGNIFSKQSSLKEQINQVKATSDYFKKALNTTPTKSLDFKG